MATPRIPRRDVTGQRFGRILVLDGSKGICFCRCDCGTEWHLRRDYLRRGCVTSCGCSRKTHGMSKSDIYHIWTGMKSRCYDTGHVSYPRYGGRGIVMCDEWHQFERFMADMGPRPSKQHSIHRIDNDGPYSPENCCWATPEQQASNQSRRGRPTHCKRGHEFTPENSYCYTDKAGQMKRQCRICQRAYNTIWHRERRRLNGARSATEDRPHT